MKNIAVSAKRQPETVAHEDMIAAMDPNYQFTLDEIFALLHDRPRAAVRDTLQALIAKGVIWRDATTSRVRYALLEGDALRDAIERNTKRSASPAWMLSNLSGYDAQNRRFRSLCMAARK